MEKSLKKHIFYFQLIIFSILVFGCSHNEEIIVKKPYPDELSSKIGRGLVCFNTENSNFLSWRKLSADSGEYKIWRKVDFNKGGNIELIGKSKTTFFRDIKLKKNVNYKYAISNKARLYLNSFLGISKNSVIYESHSALSFDLKQSYKQARIVTGDLTGDGELEVIISYSNNVDVDPYKKAWSKSTHTIKVAAFLRNGDRLWTIDLGWGIESGTMYNPMIVWDLNADGKSEVILKTNKSDDPLNYSTEYLTVLNGETGKILNETRWPSPAVTDKRNYNSNSRNYLAIAHLDGENPTIIAARGTYFAQVLDAFDISLNKLWERVIGKDIEPNKFSNKYVRKIKRLFSKDVDKYRGSHSLPIADIDENGSEEIMWGNHCITLGGKDIWKVKERFPFVGHLDIVYSADMIKEIPGKETYYTREGWLGPENNIGMMLVDKDGKTIWGNWDYTHVDGGWGAKVIPGDDECQFFGYDVQKKVWKTGSNRTFVNPTQDLFNAKGKFIFHPDSSWIRSFPIDWEGDGIREICTELGVLKRAYSEKQVGFDEGKGIAVKRANDYGEKLADFGEGIRYAVKWGGDLFGDHREELIVAPQDGKVYIVFNTDDLKFDPKITKLADRQYKNDLSRTAMQFNVIPTESGYIPLNHIQK